MRDGFFLRSFPVFGGCLGLIEGCISSEGGGDISTTGETSEGGTNPSTVGVDSTTDPTTSTSTSTSTGTPGDDTSTGGDPSCPGTCAAPTPEGWFGPAIYARVGELAAVPPCPEDYPNPGPTVLDGFNAPGSAQCDCACNFMAGTPCDLDVTLYSGTTCQVWLNSQQAGETCSGALIGESLQVRVGYNYGGQQATCQKEEAEFIPPVEWDSAIRSCRLPETPLACNDGAGVCLPPAPEGFENAWCIYAQGDVACPAGDFSNKSVFFTNAMDTRECSSCSCGTAGTSCDDGVLQLFAGPDCAGSPVEEITPGGYVCHDVTAGSFAASFSAGPPCPVTSIPEPMGEVAAVGPFTFCCG